MIERVSNQELHDLASSHGWELLDIQENIGMVSFSKMLGETKSRINIYKTKMTVTTYINHPKLGKNQLYRKNVSMAQLKKIFENPRVHTNKGYRTK